MLRSRKATCASRYSAAPPSSATAGTSFSGSSTCDDRALHPDRDQRDAGDHREVQVGVGVAGDLVALAPSARFRQAPRRDDRGDVEVDPPQRRRDHDPEQRRDDDAGVDRRLRADADRDDRLAQRDDHDRAVALGEVPGHELPAVGAEQERAARVEQQREAPQRRAARRPEVTAATNSRPAPIAVLTASPMTERRSASSSRLASMNSTMCATRTTA